MTNDSEKPASSISEGGLETPLVSVVIPVYNVFQYVTQCLDYVGVNCYDLVDI